MKVPGSENAGEGMAACYRSFIRVVNRRDRRFFIEVEEGVPVGYPVWPGMGCFMPGPESCNNPLQNGCAMRTITHVDVHGLGTSMTVCICEPAQVGGPSVGSMAGFTFNRQVDSPSTGSPIVFTSKESGAEMWWHYPFHTDNDVTFVEVRHYDGTIARYQRHPGVRLRDTVTGIGGDYWKLVWVRDPYDNQTSYFYSGVDLIRVEYPNGLVELWNWTPGWVASSWGAGFSAIEVTFEDRTNPSNPTVLTDLTYAMVFENVVANKTHFHGRMVAHFGQAAPMVSQPSPPTDNLFDVGTAADVRAVTSFVYGGSGGTADDMTRVQKYWVPTSQGFAPPSGSPTPILDTTYVASGTHAGKVESQTLVRLGLTTTYSYGVDPVTYPGSLPSGVTLSTIRIEGPDHNREVREFDPQTGRVYRTILDPGANGRPRQAEGAFSGAGYPFGAEPERIAIDFTYDATCVCQKPIKVEVGPIDANHAFVGAPRVTEYTYDTVTSMVRTIRRPNPSTASGAPATILDVFEYHAEAGEWSPRWLLRQTTASGTPDQAITEYAYLHPMARQSATHGKMQGSVVRSFKSVVVQTGVSSTTTADVAEYVVFNLTSNPGWSSQGGMTQPYVGPASGYPRGQPRFVVDGDGVLTVFDYSGTHGQLEKVAVGGAGGVVSDYQYDLWGRLQSVTTNSASSLPCTWQITQDVKHRTLVAQCTTLPNIEVRNYFDRWSNLAVTMRKNKASNGGSPQRHGAGSSAREWVRTEYLWEYSQLLETRQDRRPLDEGDGSPFGGQNPLMAVTSYEHDDGTLRITNPNGSVTEVVFDGYGTPFLTRILESGAPGASTLEVSRTYVNGWLEPVSIVSGNPGVGGNATRWMTIARNAAGAITSITEPTTATGPAGYTGSLGGSVHQYDVDSLGRTVGSRVLAAAGGAVQYQARTLFDQLGRVRKREVDLLGANPGTAWSINRFASGRLSQLLTSQSNNQPLISYTYDALGRITDIYDDQPVGGNRTKYFYIAGSDFVQRTERLLVNPGATSVETYAVSYGRDALGRATSVTEAPGSAAPRVHQYAYSSLGVADVYTDPTGRIQKFLFDALGRRIEHIKLGDGSDFIRNTAGFVDTGLANSRTRMDQVDGLGHITATHFDFAGRRFLVQNPGADFLTEPTSSAPNMPHCEFVTFDALSQATNFYDGDNGNTAFHYDGMGRLIQRELLTAQEAISTFNSKDVLIRDVLGRITGTNSWSAVNGGAPNGTPLSNASLLLVEASTFDSLGRLLNEDLQLAAMVHGLSVRSVYSGVKPFRDGVSYDDNLAGNVGQQLDLSFAPDAVNRLATIDWARPGLGSQTLADYTWRGGMRMSRTVNYGGSSVQATGVTQFAYDALGRLTLIQDDVTPTGGSAVETNKFEYEYDLANNLKKEKYAKVGGWKGDRFTYDAYHRLKEAYIGVDQATMSASADPTGYTAAQTKKKESFTLDEAQNREEVRLQQGTVDVSYPYTLEDGSTGFEPSNRYVTAHGWLVEHDKRGNLIYDGNFYYRYDYLNRLQEVWRVIPDDQEGLSTASAPQDGDKYAPVNEVGALEQSRQEAYNSVYNLLHRVPLEHKSAAFRAQLKRTISGGVVRLTDPAATGPGTGTGGGGMPRFILPANLELVALYGYDAFNRRVVRVVVGQETYVSTYDGWREVVEHVLNLGSGQAEPVKQFVHGSGLDEVLSYRKRVGVAGAYTWEEYFVQHGGQDTPSKLLNASGAIVEQYEYDAYGKATIYNATGTAAMSWAASRGLPFLWKGIRFDNETGLYYMRNRYYSAVTGRFLSQDPIGVWGDPVNAGNAYGYVGSSPIGRRDPLGLIWFEFDPVNCTLTLHLKLQAHFDGFTAAQSAAWVAAAERAIEDTWNANAVVIAPTRQTFRGQVTDNGVFGGNPCITTRSAQLPCPCSQGVRMRVDVHVFNGGWMISEDVEAGVTGLRDRSYASTSDAWLDRDDVMRQTIPQLDGVIDQATIAHEFGHMIGLGHTNVGPNIVPGSRQEYYEPGTNQLSQNIMGAGSQIDARNAGPWVDALNSVFVGGGFVAR